MGCDFQKGKKNINRENISKAANNNISNSNNNDKHLLESKSIDKLSANKYSSSETNKELIEFSKKTNNNDNNDKNKNLNQGYTVIKATGSKILIENNIVNNNNSNVNNNYNNNKNKDIDVECVTNYNDNDKDNNNNSIDNDDILSVVNHGSNNNIDLFNIKCNEKTPPEKSNIFDTNNNNIIITTNVQNKDVNCNTNITNSPKVINSKNTNTNNSNTNNNNTNKKVIIEKEIPILTNNNSLYSSSIDTIYKYNNNSNNNNTLKKNKITGIPNPNIEEHLKDLKLAKTKLNIRNIVIYGNKQVGKHSLLNSLYHNKLIHQGDLVNYECLKKCRFNEVGVNSYSIPTKYQPTTDIPKDITSETNLVANIVEDVEGLKRRLTNNSGKRSFKIGNKKEMLELNFFLVNSAEKVIEIFNEDDGACLIAMFDYSSNISFTNTVNLINEISNIGRDQILVVGNKYDVNKKEVNGEFSSIVFQNLEIEFFNLSIKNDVSLISNSNNNTNNNNTIHNNNITINNNNNTITDVNNNVIKYSNIDNFNKMFIRFISNQSVVYTHNA